ncbi:MAG TPA: response regulator transcription factor [Trichormus sp.]
MAKILFVEDDAALSATVTQVLKAEQFNVELSENGNDALHRLAIYEYDLVILDWNLPEVSGPEICRQFRQKGGSTPILMLTGRNSMNDKLDGFDAGADDYLTKPFNAQELVARAKALLRRPKQMEGTTLQCGKIALDTSKRMVTRNGEEITMQPLEFAVLEFLMRHPNQVFTTDTLLKRCWNADVDASIFATYTCIRRIRKKLDVPGEESIIKTIPNVGYRLDAPKE